MQIEAKNLGYKYKEDKWIFRNLNFSIKSNEILGINAPSGFGKTTLSKVLAGYMKPKEGEVLLNGKKISSDDYNPIQLILQHPEKAVNTRWKIKDIVSEGYKPSDEILKSFGIEKEWLNRWPNELSGGELQRFCIVRALSPKTKFIIADELTTMLDAITQAQIWKSFLDITAKSNIGVIVISHDKNLVNRLCTRVIDLDENKTKNSLSFKEAAKTT